MNCQENKNKIKEKDYFVEKILNRRQTDEGKLEYFLKWKDLPE